VDRAIVPQAVTFTAFLVLGWLAVYVFSSRSFLSVDLILAFIAFALIAFALIAMYVRLRLNRRVARQAAMYTLAWILGQSGVYVFMSRSVPSAYFIFACIAFTFIAAYCFFCARRNVA